MKFKGLKSHSLPVTHPPWQPTIPLPVKIHDLMKDIQFVSKSNFQVIDKLIVVVSIHISASTILLAGIIGVKKAGTSHLLLSTIDFALLFFFLFQLLQAAQIWKCENIFVGINCWN